MITLPFTILLSVMPKRNNQKSQAKFLFATPCTAAIAVGLGKSHTSATRSHAAYWGGPTEKIHKSDAEIRDKDDRLGTSGNINNVIQAYSGDYLSFSRSVTGSSRAFDTYTFLSNEVVADNGGPAIHIVVADLFGKEFLKQIDNPCGRENPALANAYLLVAVAYSMAVTGKGDKTLLFYLKEQLLRRVLQDIQAKSGRASPQIMGVMLLLGSPIVCLLSHDLPGGLPIREYLILSADSKHLCCTNSAVTAKESLRESKIHCANLAKLLTLEQREHQRVAHTEWLTYLSRYLEMYNCLYPRSIS